MNNTRAISISEFALPESRDMEQQVLTDAVAAPEAIGEMMRYINADSFTSDQRKHLWNSMVTMYGRGEIIDMTTMLTVEGAAFVTECITSGKSGGSARTALQHAVYLRDAAARRRTYFASIDLLRASTDTQNSETDLCAMAENLGTTIQGATGQTHEKHISEVMDKIENEMDEKEKMTAEGKKLRVTTGINSLNWYTYGGWRNGQLIVLAARPSVGKTALMMLFARSSAEAGHNVSIFSLEMSDDELGQRLLYASGKVEPVDLVTGRLQRETFKEVADKIRKLPIYVNDSSRQLEEIVARMVIQRHAGKCDIAFVDYLGLMSIATGYRENMNQAIAKITGELKSLAKRLKIPIVLLCQLNRDVAKGDRAPELYDLRDSGAIEQDADIVLMLENEKAINPDTGLCDINIWLRKNRQYKKDICVRVRPNKTYSDFTEVDISMPEAKPESINETITKELFDDDDE